jgi:hypothetical protein
MRRSCPVNRIGAGRVELPPALWKVLEDFGPGTSRPEGPSDKVGLACWCGPAKAITPSGGRFMANKYVLSGGGFDVDYTIGITPGLPALEVTEGGTTKTFTAAQITTDTTGVGRLVSVSLTSSIDTGGSRFGMFLPEIQLALGQSAPVTTVGVVESFSGPDSFPHRPTTWRCVHLKGKAEEVIVPL